MQPLYDVQYTFIHTHFSFSFSLSLLTSSYWQNTRGSRIGRKEKMQLRRRRRLFSIHTTRNVIERACFFFVLFCSVLIPTAISHTYASFSIQGCKDLSFFCLLVSRLSKYMTCWQLTSIAKKKRIELNSIRWHIADALKRDERSSLVIISRVNTMTWLLLNRWW